MFDLSFAEIAMAGFAAVIAVKPDDMPNFLRGCGQKWRAFRQWRNKWTSDIQHILDPAAELDYREPRQEMYTPEGSGDAFERYILDDSTDEREEDEAYISEQYSTATAMDKHGD